MIHPRAGLIALAIAVFATINVGAAQLWFDPTMDMGAQIAAYDQQMEAYIQQQMQALQQQADQAYADMVRFYVGYYRQHTGDHTTPDHIAVNRGAALHCQHHPVQCRESTQHGDAMAQISAAGHAQNMADIAAWGATASQIGQTNSDILDASHEGFMGNQALQDQGHAGFVQGSIHGESTFVHPGSGASFSLPVYPDPAMSYATPDGFPLAFDYQTGTWYQADAAGWWHPLQPQR